jgi:type IV secretion system protein VirB4
MMSQEFQDYQKKLSKRTAFSEMLGYGFFLNDNTVMMKDGALQAVFKYYGDDIQATIKDRQQLLATRWSQGVTKFFSDNIMIETDLIRQEANQYSHANEFPDIVSALIDQERAFQFKEQGNVYESIVYITFTYQEPKQTSTKLKKLIYDTDEEIRDKTEKEITSDFTSLLERFINYVSLGDSAKFQRLTGNEYASFLNKLMTGQNKNFPRPVLKADLDSHMSVNDFVSSTHPQIGNQFIKMLTIEGYPYDIKSMSFDILNNLPFEFRYHMRYVRLTKSQAKKRLKSLKRSWSSKAIGIKGIFNQSMGWHVTKNESFQRKADEVEVAMMENDDGYLCHGLICSQLVIYGEDKSDINLRAKEIQAYIENLGFVVREENMHATDAYIGSLVGHGDNCLRNFTQDSMTWSHCLPLSSVYAGEHYCPNPDYPIYSPPLCFALTQGSNIYRFNNFVSDVGHMTVLGPTGSGKTTLIELFLSQHRKYKNSRQIFLGKDNCAEIAVLAHGGSYFSLKDDQQNKLTLSPIANLDTVYDRDFVRAWLEDCFEINHVKLTAQMRAEIASALELLSKQDRKHRKLSNLVFQNEVLRKSFQSMNIGAFKAILSGENDNIFTNDCIGFDLTQVMSLKKEVAMPIILAILNTLTLKFQDKKPTLLILDEAWLLLDHPVFTAKLKDWLKTLRKFNVSVIFSSQSLSDVFNSDIASVIIESCPTKIFLPNVEANSSESKQYYQRYSLNQAEIDLIAQAMPKSQYYIVQPKGKRLVDIKLSDVALRFLGVNPSREHDHNKLFFEHFDRSNPNWVANYLNACKLKEAADFVANYMAV